MFQMPLGAHGAAISTIFNVEIFKQIQQILAKKSVSRYRYFKMTNTLDTDTDRY